MISQTREFGKAIRPLFADPVTNVCIWSQDLALCTVEVVMEDLEFNKSKKWNISDTKDWLKDISYYQSSIVSVLNLKTLSDVHDAKYVQNLCCENYMMHFNHFRTAVRQIHNSITCM